MTVPPGARAAVGRVSDMVRAMVPFARRGLTPDERRIGIYLRGNTDLFEGLSNIMNSRIGGRANLPVPSDPLECMKRLAMDKELRLFLGQLENIYRSPAIQPAEDSEQPA